jgi:hypothetical protein
MNGWEMWKKGFGAWERTTSEYLDKVLRNPAVLGPAGAMLTATMKTKTATDKAFAGWWGAIGLPTKRDQERSLHKLNQLESRLLDLEEELHDQRSRES